MSWCAGNLKFTLEPPKRFEHSQHLGWLAFQQTSSDLMAQPFVPDVSSMIISELYASAREQENLLSFSILEVSLLTLSTNLIWSSF